MNFKMFPFLLLCFYWQTPSWEPGMLMIPYFSGIKLKRKYQSTWLRIVYLYWFNREQVRHIWFVFQRNVYFVAVFDILCFLISEIFGSSCYLYVFQLKQYHSLFHLFWSKNPEETDLELMTIIAITITMLRTRFHLGIL